MNSSRPKIVRLGLVVSTLALAVVLLAGFKSPDELGPSTRAGGSKTGVVAAVPGSTDKRSSGSTSARGSANGSSASNGTGGSSSASGAKTVTGPVEDAFYGPVEVAVTISNGTIVDVQAVELPSGGRSGSISRIAGPILREQALSTKSAAIDGVSGATYTSRAYAASLQAALDQAGV